MNEYRAQSRTLTISIIVSCNLGEKTKTLQEIKVITQMFSKNVPKIGQQAVANLFSEWACLKELGYE